MKSAVRWFVPRMFLCSSCQKCTCDHKPNAQKQDWNRDYIGEGLPKPVQACVAAVDQDSD